MLHDEGLSRYYSSSSKYHGTNVEYGTVLSWWSLHQSRKSYTEKISGRNFPSEKWIWLSVKPIQTNFETDYPTGDV